MSEIRVAHVTTGAMSLQYLLRNQLCSLQRSNYQVWGISAPGPEVAELEAAGIRHVAVPMTRRLTPLADLVSLYRLYRVMRQVHPTIVHTHTPKPGLLGQLAARLARVPIVVNTLHGFYFHDGMPPLWRRFYILIEKIAAKCSDLILSQSNEDIQTAIHELICQPDQIKFLGNGIDINQFDRRRIAEEAVASKRREFGILKESLVVGFAGRLVAEKGILDLMAAMRLVRRNIPHVRLLVVGPVDYDKADPVNPSVAASFEIADLCIFTGLRQDMPEMYALMDLFVLPSHREGFPRSLMESSAMSLPCVATNIRGCREAVEVDQNGWLVPPGDAAALAQAIIGLLNNPEKRRSFGAAARCIAEQRFDEQSVFSIVIAEYARLLHAKGLNVPLPLPL